MDILLRRHHFKPQLLLFSMFRFHGASCRRSVLGCRLASRIEHTSHNNSRFLLTRAGPLGPICARSVTFAVSQAHGRNQQPRRGCSHPGRETQTGPRAEGEGGAGTAWTAGEREVWLNVDGTYVTMLVCMRLISARWQPQPVSTYSLRTDAISFWHIDVKLLPFGLVPNQQSRWNQEKKRFLSKISILEA